MGYLLSKLTTRTGDTGMTSLADGTRVEKDNPYINALGLVDQLNSTLGLLASTHLPASLCAVVTRIQNNLFDLGAELRSPRKTFLQLECVAILDKWIEEFDAQLPPLQEFILPGGCESAALCHVARTECRALERAIVSLHDLVAGEPEVRLKYLNRLSDLLFILARLLNQREGVKEIHWTSDMSRRVRAE